MLAAEKQSLIAVVLLYVFFLESHYTFKHLKYLRKHFFDHNKFSGNGPKTSSYIFWTIINSPTTRNLIKKINQRLFFFLLPMFSDSSNRVAGDVAGHVAGRCRRYYSCFSGYCSCLEYGNIIIPCLPSCFRSHRYQLRAVPSPQDEHFPRLPRRWEQ